ncbi:MAG: hypothetical protein JWM68_3013 [Verrucomicrobiales bacterium]|nr:hypothetical protein [Verrucomicrobiales bacterium]
MNTQTIKRFSTLLGLLTVLLITGCASTDEIVLDSTKRASTTSVDIYKDGKLPDRKFKEIAELSFLGPRDAELRAQKRFMGQAQKMGGNGVIFSVDGGSVKGGGTLFQTVAYVFKGKVIVYE